MIYKKIDLHIAIFSNVTEEVASEYIDFRISVRKPLTQGAFNRAMNEAVKCESLGIGANEAILITIDKGWHGVTKEYIAKELSNRFEATASIYTINSPALTASTRSRSLIQDLNDKSWAD